MSRWSWFSMYVIDRGVWADHASPVLDEAIDGARLVLELAEQHLDRDALAEDEERRGLMACMWPLKQVADRARAAIVR